MGTQQQQKIAHIGNISGIATTLSHEQRAEGHRADIFVFDDVTEKLFGGAKINYNSRIAKWSFHRKLRGYDVWHYHYPYGSLNADLEKRKDGKIFLKHYHGDDLRGRRDEGFCIVSTPDLLRFAPNGQWIPTPVDLARLEVIGRGEPSSIPKIAHYPYYEVMKSIKDYHSTALARLERQGLCSVVRIVDMPYIESLQAMAGCDIVVGKILPDVGWFGRFELEGMAIGKPVIAYVSEELYEKYRPPIYRTTKDTFEQDLAALLSDVGERARLSNEGAQYVRKNHDVLHVSQLVEDCYRRLA